MFEDILAQIKPLDAVAMEKCQIRLDNLTKPLNSLHSFEHIARQMAGITGQVKPCQLQKSIIVMAADHGIMTEISSLQEITTATLVEDACQEGATVQIFAKHVQANLVIVDIGVASVLPSFARLQKRKVAYGTNNITKQAAMTRQQAIDAILVGIEMAQTQIQDGAQVVGLGAIGRGSTVASNAIIACYSEKCATELLQRSGECCQQTVLWEQGLLSEALTTHQVQCGDALEVLSTLGGLEMAGLVGVILGATAGGAAVVLDGLTSMAAALIAVKMAPQVKDYLVASHFGVTAANKEALALIDIPGYLHLDIQRGDGTGAALGMSLINASLHVINDMKTFGEAAVPVAQDGPGALKQNSAIR